MVTGFADMSLEETPLLLMNPSPLQLLFFLKACEIIFNRTHQNTSDSLKASMVASFRDMPREQITLATRPPYKKTLRASRYKKTLHGPRNSKL